MPAALIDTDVFVDHIRGRARFPVLADGAYSVVTRCELFAGRADQERAVRALLRPLRELDVDAAIAERAGRLRRTAGLATPDALIAATALAHGLGVMTRNVRHFARVDALEVVAP